MGPIWGRQDPDGSHVGPMNFVIWVVLYFLFWYRKYIIEPYTLTDNRHYTILITHDDVIKWKPFPYYWPFVRGVHRAPPNSRHKGQWRGALMFSLICAWIKGWTNNRYAGDLRRHRVYYDVTVMYPMYHWAHTHHIVIFFFNFHDYWLSDSLLICIYMHPQSYTIQPDKYRNTVGFLLCLMCLGTGLHANVTHTVLNLFITRFLRTRCGT